MGLIDVDAFLKDLDYEGADVCEVYDGGYCAIHGYSFDLIKEVINKQPTIEAEPIRHGRWIAYLDGDHIMPERYYRCSECGRVERRKESYCHCGAKMDKED